MNMPTLKVRISTKRRPTNLAWWMFVTGIVVAAAVFVQAVL
jgi:hypothetical protein